MILGRFDAEAVLRAIHESKCGSSVMVPTHFVRLLQLPDEVKRKYDVSSMKLLSHTGAKCPVDVKRHERGKTGLEAPRQTSVNRLE